MSSGIEEIKYRGNRNEDLDGKIMAALGKPNAEKKSFIPEETKKWGNQQNPSLAQNDYGFQNFAMIIPETTTATSVYVSAAEIK